MKLLVRLIEAKGIPAMDLNGFSDPYVKLQLGRQKFRSKVVKKCLNPTWCEEFTFKVDDLKEELIVSVLDEDKYFNDDFVGQIKVPICRVFEAKDQSLGTAWYRLCPKNEKAKSKDCGEILLTICFSQNNTLHLPPAIDPGSKKHSASVHNKLSRSLRARPSSPTRVEEAVSSKEEKSLPPTLAGRIAHVFNKNADTTSMSCLESSNVSEHESVNSVDLELSFEEQSSSVDFEEMMRTLEMRERGGEVPSSLPGGVVLDQLYGIAPRELNSILFSPNSSFWKSSAETVGSTDLQMGSWKFDDNSKSLKRVVSYTKAPTKMIKALKAVEDQTYLKADGKNYVVLASVDTPDAPYGKTFRAEVLYCITPGPEQPSGEQSSRLVVSWRINFLQSTMMKGMIEGGARQGIKQSFEQYEKILSQNVKPLKDTGSEKDTLLASLQVERQSDWELAVQYFANFTVISAIFMGLYMLAHLWMAMPSTTQGLELVGLDLPDSISELIVCGVLVLLGKWVLKSISRFMHARVQKGSDHGIKARGDGWLLTVALIEGRNLTAVGSGCFSDPYVVFTCNGKTRTSSIKFQRSEPLWNEIFEFDAMNEPPSTLDVEVFGFDGPFDGAVSLGRAEINFLKSNISELSDIWIPLHGNLVQTCQSKLHLKIFLNNTRGGNIVKDYIAKMEKEVGKKIKLRSPQTNSAFQKLFGLPPEEFLINDFACSLKRKMPLQGRLFLSSRIIGFHADLFGHKTKFFFLWDDIGDIQVISPCLASMGSPNVIMILRPGRGFDAKHGARMQDAEGRLKFHFHSFVSFNVAHRTIMALWRARALTPGQKVQIAQEESAANDGHAADESIAESFHTVEEELETRSIQEVDEQSDAKILQNEEVGSFGAVGNVDMCMVYSSVLSLPISFFMELFRGTELDERIMQSAGCLNYTHTPWESEKPNVYQRQLFYKFDRLISHYTGEVSSTQQKSPLSCRNGWLIEEFMNLRGFLLGEYFTIHLRYLVEGLPSKSVGCSFQVYFGITWMKHTKHQKRITKSIVSNLQKRLKIISSAMEKEYISQGTDAYAADSSSGSATSNNLSPSTTSWFISESPMSTMKLSRQDTPQSYSF